MGGSVGGGMVWCEEVVQGRRCVGVFRGGLIAGVVCAEPNGITGVSGVSGVNKVCYRGRRNAPHWLCTPTAAAMKPAH